MAGSQIATALTAFQSKFYNGISLSNRDNDDEPEILAGSLVEISNSYFYFGSNESITNWSGITTGDTAYVALTPAGTAGNQTVTAGWVATAPTYIAAKGGWYLSAGSNIKYVASAIKHSATSYGFKQKLMGENITTTAPTLLTTLTYSGDPTTGSDFTVYEPCVIYGFFDTTPTNAVTIYAIIQLKVNGTYSTESVLNDENIIASTTNLGSALTFGYWTTLMPGIYRLLLDTSAAPGNTPICTLYRAGRLTDVTQ